MSIFWLTVYILIWPLIAAVVLLVMTKGVIDDVRTARREGTDVV